MSDRASEALELTTVVFVDLEGSTALIDRAGDEAALAAIHFQLDAVRERIEPYGGREVKSLGDGLLLTFSSPRQAVAFALACQGSLSGSTPRIRFGINAGEVIGGGADVHGGTVNAAARIADRASGGEVMVSDVVRQLVGNAPSVRFEDRGRRRLKGFSERWHLWLARAGTDKEDVPATIGRTRELAALTELLSSTVMGRGEAILLEGEAGIGKTHLVRHVSAQARRFGLGVIEVTADEVVRQPGVIPHRLLAASPTDRAPRRRLDEALNVSQRAATGADDLSFAVIEASVDVAEELARDRPLLLVTEDLQWADDLSIRVLSAIIPRVAAGRCSVVGSLRPAPRPAALDRLVDRVANRFGAHVQIGPLDEADSQALASALTGAAPGSALRARLTATAGNPLFVTELLRYLDEEGLLRIESGVAEIVPGGTPTNLHQTLVRRLTWLAPETNELLRLASLLGSTFTLHDVAAITGRSVIEVAAWLREAVVAGLIVDDDDRLTFRHELIREAVYGHMLPAERRDLHRAAGQALAAAGAPTQQVAQQFARGALPGDVDAIGWLERAALESTHVSPPAALNLLEQAITLAPEQWTERPALQSEMIRPLVTCGRYDDAERIANDILAATPSKELTYVALQGLAMVHGSRGDITAAIAALERAAAAPGAPHGEADQHRCVAARLAMFSGAMTVDAARRLGETVLARAVADDDPTTQCIAHQTLGFAAWLAGYGTDGLRHLKAAVALFDSGRVLIANYPDGFLAIGLLELDALDEAQLAADKACRRGTQRGALSLLPLSYLAAAGAHFYAGSWDDAAVGFEAGRAVIEDIGNLTYALYYDAALARIATHRGELDDARSHLTAGLQLFGDGITRLGADWLFGAQAEFLAATGDLDAALAVAEATWEQTTPIRYVFGCRQRATFLVRLAVATGRNDLAQSVTADLEEGARRTPAISATAAALQSRGLHEGDPERLLQATAQYRNTPLRPDLAACCEDAASVLAAQGRRQESVALLRDAAASYRDMGAAADTIRVDAAMRALGGRHRRVQPRPSFGWESLTPIELDVTKLATEGLTNPEIGARLYISRRTVETHLSHVFSKLGLASRTQLAAEYSRRSSPATPDVAAHAPP